MRSALTTARRSDGPADPLWPRSWLLFFLLPLTWMFVLDPRGVSQYPDPSWAIVAWRLLLGAEIAAIPLSVWILSRTARSGGEPLIRRFLDLYFRAFLIAAVPVGLVWHLAPKALFRLYFSVERLPSVRFAEAVASGRADGMLAVALAVVFISLRLGALAYLGRRERNRPAARTGDELREHILLGWSLWFLCLPVLSLFFQGREPFEKAEAANLVVGIGIVLDAAAGPAAARLLGRLRRAPLAFAPWLRAWTWASAAVFGLGVVGHLTGSLLGWEEAWRLSPVPVSRILAPNYVLEPRLFGAILLSWVLRVAIATGVLAFPSARLTGRGNPTPSRSSVPATED